MIVCVFTSDHVLIVDHVNNVLIFHDDGCFLLHG